MGEQTVGTLTVGKATTDVDGLEMVDPQVFLKGEIRTMPEHLGQIIRAAIEQHLGKEAAEAFANGAREGLPAAETWYDPDAQGDLPEPISE